MGPFSNSGDLPFPRKAGRTDKGNHLESGEIRGNMLTRRALLSDEWLNCICRFGVMGGKEFTLSNPLFTLSALDNMPFFTI